MKISDGDYNTVNICLFQERKITKIVIFEKSVDKKGSK